MNPELVPALDRAAFHCPAATCGIYAAQHWSLLIRNYKGSQQVDGFKIATCQSCGAHSIWHGAAMIYPLSRQGETPHTDMPEDVLAVYEEARSVAPISRKSAAGLLRLSLQMLIDDLEPGSKPINDKIGALVKRGLDPQMQQAMDVLRVVGNESVHPGTIDLDADDALLPALFNLVNLIVEQVVARPKHVGGLFGMLPPAKLDAIQKRDRSEEHT